MSDLVPVILGSGSEDNLLPLCKNKPRQFLKLAKNKESLFKVTLEVAMLISGTSNLVIIADPEYKDLFIKEVSEIDKNLNRNIIWQSDSDLNINQITRSVNYIIDNFNDPILWFMPSTNIISKPEILVSLLNKIMFDIKSEKTVSFGIAPKNINYNHSYIIPDNILCENKVSYAVKDFIKSSKDENLSEQENYLLNSGMFVCDAEKMLEEINLRQNFDANISLEDFIFSFNSDLVVYPVEMGWSDVSSWFNIWELSKLKSGENLLDNFLKTIKDAA